MERQHEGQMTPEQQTQRIHHLLAQAQQACKTDSSSISDPRAEALFTMLAGVLGGAMRVLQDYQRQELQWQKEQREPERRVTIDIDQIEPSSKAAVTVPYD
ncbi:hypothetical protein KSF_053250 [Reticulibacter mediterranei]|uniref:Uncharacterized protein n=1 Tax=Reticulibacter mediterranei TaxID=2778369 RepID=A0A8J3IQW5_9CHLR|nr:hypothetical protein [Reticulibacter mediterranei]GHO95277.1 hypothetical protein KSF_053250 [Reticulibacter mediterranei]